MKLTNRLPPLIAAALLMLPGCTRHIVHPIETIHYRSDTLLRESLRVDSLIIRDSIVMLDRGDTIIREVWRNRDRVLRDNNSRTRSIVDTIRHEIPVPVETPATKVSAKPSFRQRLKSAAADILLTILFISAIYTLIKTIKS